MSCILLQNLQNLHLHHLNYYTEGTNSRDGVKYLMSEDIKIVNHHGLSSIGNVMRSLPKLVSFPEGLQQHLTKLESLFIEECESSTSLPEWVANLASLRELKIKNCPHLVNCYGDSHIPIVTVECGYAYSFLPKSLMYERWIGGHALGHLFFHSSGRK